MVKFSVLKEIWRTEGTAKGFTFVLPLPYAEMQDDIDFPEEAAQQLRDVIQELDAKTCYGTIVVGSLEYQIVNEEYEGLVATFGCPWQIMPFDYIVV